MTTAAQTTQLFSRLRSFLPTNIESGFFSIVRTFCMGVATLAVLVFLATITASAFKFTSTADTDAKKPEIMYQNYQAELEDTYNQRYESEDDSSDTQQSKSDQLEQESRELEIRKKFMATFTLVEQNINVYARMVGDKPTSDYPTLDRIVARRLIDPDKPDYTLLNQLLTFTEDLKNKAAELSKLESNDPRKVKWVNALDWFLEQEGTHLKTEERRIEREYLQVGEDKQDALQLMMASGVAFLIFMLFVIILVLLKIETNTRQLNSAK